MVRRSNMRPHRAFLLVLAATILFALAACANQTNPPPPPPPPPVAERASPTPSTKLLAPENLQKKPGYTEVGVSVSDRDGQEVSGLTKDDFGVFFDQQRRDIAFFSVDNRPPSGVGILIDTSGSTEAKLPAIK